MIYQPKKMLLFDKENTWMKKGRNLFDVEMGTNDGAKVWKLVETFSLVKISEICNKKKSDYIGMAVYQPLETKVVLN